VRLVAARDHLFEMLILRLDDVIGLVAVELGVTWPTHVSAGHRLHAARLDPAWCAELLDS